MPRRLVVLAVWVALAGASAPSAAADAPWSAPRDVGARVARVAAPALEITAPGTGLLTWGTRAVEPATPQAPTTDAVVVATLAPDGTLVSKTLSDDLAIQAACGARCVAVLRQRILPSDRRVALGVSIGAGAASLGRLQPLARYLPAGFSETAGASSPAIAGDRSGWVAVAWIEAEGRRLRVALRRPGEPFGRPRTIATQQRGVLRGVQLAFEDRAVLDVAYVRESLAGQHRRRVVEARRVFTRGTAEPAQVVGPAPQSYADLRIATAPGGRTVVAWGNVHGTVMGFEDRWVVRAAIRPGGSRRFGVAQVLDPGAVKEAGAPGRIGLGMAADGTATVAWAAYARALPHPLVDTRAAIARPGRRFGAPQRVASNGLGGMRDLAVAPNGAAVMTWASYTPLGSAIMAAVRAPGGQRFGAPEIVAPARSSFFNAVDFTPTAAIDATGAATVVWAAEDTAGDPPMHVPLSAVLRLSSRPVGSR